MIQAKFNCMGKTNSKFIVNGGFVFNEATSGGMFSGMLCRFNMEGLSKNMNNLWIVCILSQA
jgi:hypothetical protein